MGFTSNQRGEMDDALRDVVLPVLVELEFQGGLPHARRFRDDRIELITFQFDRRGGGFCIELGICGRMGFVHPSLGLIPPATVCAWDVATRTRLTPSDAIEDHWFRFDGWLGTSAWRTRRCARAAAKLIPTRAMPWFDRTPIKSAAPAREGPS